MANGTPVEIKPAKGRPMLTWVGKRPLRNVLAYPAQLVENYVPTLPAQITPQPELWSYWPEGFPQGGLLFHGDNKDVLAYLLANGFRGKVQMVYIDPPFDSAADYIRHVSLRGYNGAPKLVGEGYDLGEQVQYTDIWTNDNYLQFIYERLSLLKELLTSNGSIWLHCDWRKNAQLRILMDEVFGSENFKAQVAWRTMTSSGYKGKSSLGRSHADLIYYSMGSDFIYNPIHGEISPEMLSRYSHEDPDGRKYKDSYLGDVTPDTIQELKKKNLLYVTSTGGYRIKHYLDEAEGLLVDDMWDDIDVENSQSSLLTGYPTQKPEALLERILTMTTNSRDLVLDCFLGSGTTAAVAQKLGRRWIGADINKGAIQTTTKRLQGIIEKQIQEESPQPALMPAEEDSPRPAQLAFSVFRVNDYDLQIQHNEALNLACEHIGITRTKTHAFFDGSLGKELVKIVPFNHPLTLLDLEEIRNELDNRPEEERNIVMVCLGRELAAHEWLEEWNKNRKRTGLPNQIRVIEVRSDPKYGGFFVHKPAEAEVQVRRTPEGILVEILNFISPTIIERLKQQTGVLTPQIEDWRAMVDSVMIDTAYNGEVFNIVTSDIPEKKSDLVNGKYSIPVPEGQVTVAVKITDMLGEDVLVTKQV